MAETQDQYQARIAADHLARQQAAEFQPHRPPSATIHQITESKAQSILSHLTPGEPYFVFRAQDILSSFALEAYLTLVEKFNPTGPQAESLVDTLAEFRSWQQANPQRVKLPD